MYFNHNIQFIWFAAMQEGPQAPSALAAARKMVGNLPPELIAQMSMLEMAPPYPIMTLVRFGRWDEALKEPGPPAAERYARAVWHYARGMASAGQGDRAGAATALDSLRAGAALVAPRHDGQHQSGAAAGAVAVSALAGEIAARGQHTDEAVRRSRSAVAEEDSLHYDEPPTWYWPVRHALGSALLGAGRAREAETVYREDLRRHPEKRLVADGAREGAARPESRRRRRRGRSALPEGLGPGRRQAPGSTY